MAHRRGCEGRVFHRHRVSDRSRPAAAVTEEEAAWTPPSRFRSPGFGRAMPMLQAAPAIRAVAVFEEICRRHPEIAPGVRRTLERRVARWRALHGPSRDVTFRQERPPGRMGLSDFTDMGFLGVTIAGEPLAHRLYHFRLAFSGFEHAMWCSAARASWRSPRACRTPCGRSGACRNNTAATACRPRSAISIAPHEYDLTRRYEELCAHYGMTPSRNSPGLAHENGAIESAHGHLKKAIEDELLLRGAREFAELAAYRRFI